MARRYAHPHAYTPADFRIEEANIQQTARNIIDQVKARLLPKPEAIEALRGVGFCEPEILEVLA
jgi:hypothetical protein